MQKYIGSWSTREVKDLSPVVKLLAEWYALSVHYTSIFNAVNFFCMYSHNRKYIAKVCDAIQDLLNKRYIYISEVCMWHCTCACPYSRNMC